jgi:hypothetical protein
MAALNRIGWCPHHKARMGAFFQRVQCNSAGMKRGNLHPIVRHLYEASWNIAIDQTSAHRPDLSQIGLRYKLGWAANYKRAF